MRYEDFIASRVHATGVLVSTEVAPSVRDVLSSSVVVAHHVNDVFSSFFLCLSVTDRR